MNREMAVCAKPGCGGILEFGTDGLGRTVEKCPKCSARKPAARAIAPVTAATPASPNRKAALSCPKCERTFTSQGWFDRHKALCTGTKPAAAAKPRATPPPSRTPPAPPVQELAPVRAARVALSLDVIRAAARHVGIADEQAERLEQLLRFLVTLPYPQPANGGTG